MRDHEEDRSTTATSGRVEASDRYDKNEEIMYSAKVQRGSGRTKTTGRMRSGLKEQEAPSLMVT